MSAVAVASQAVLAIVLMFLLLPAVIYNTRGVWHVWGFVFVLWVAAVIFYAGAASHIIA